MATFGKNALARFYELSKQKRINQLQARQVGDELPPADDRAELLKRLGKSASGRQRQRNGAELEDRCLTWAGLSGIELFKIPQGARRIRGGDMIAIQTPFDFAGAVKIGGRCIVFDAKNIDKSDKHQSFTVGLPLVKLHQIESLRRMGQAGAIAGLLISCGPRDDIRWLHWRELVYGAVIAWDSRFWDILSMPISEPIGFRKLLEIMGSA